MSIGDIKAGGWAPNEKLTSGHLTAVRNALINCLDRSVAGDTLSGAITVASTGSFSFASGSSITMQSGTSISLLSGSSIAFAPSSSITGTITQGAGAITLADVTMAGTNRVKVASRNFTRVVNSPGVTSFRQYLVTGGVAYVPHFHAGVASLGLYEQLDVTYASPQIQFEVDIPDGATLTGADVQFWPASGHAGQPNVMPGVSLYKRNVTSGAASQLASASLPWPGTANYEQPTGQVLTLGPISDVVDRTLYRYFVRFTGESGANAVLGLTVEAPRFIETVTAYDES